MILSGREEALQVICNFYKRPPRSFILHLFHNTIFKSARTFAFLLLPLQRYHLRTRLQVGEGNRPLALSKHCVLSGLWLLSSGEALLSVSSWWCGPCQRKRKNGFVCVAQLNLLKFLLYLILLAMCEIPPLLQNKY